jgi:hypothetical protein
VRAVFGEFGRVWACPGIMIAEIIKKMKKRPNIRATPI